MKKLLVITFVSLILLSGCNTEDEYIYWTEKTDNQIQRLDGANIKYEIKGGEIWVREKDMSKVVACCS
ncbi:hypothetical protein ACIQD3_19480 [Peribacillus loiseleuriae]|uniref:hypothetical protein n=1 Tax=Peribacillus loiseleuriae TaxID=1679170 RepID=UPI0038302CF0